MLYYNFFISNGKTKSTRNKHYQHLKWLIILWMHPGGSFVRGWGGARGSLALPSGFALYFTSSTIEWFQFVAKNKNIKNKEGGEGGCLKEVERTNE
jgi:hypothetical protein